MKQFCLVLCISFSMLGLEGCTSNTPETRAAETKVASSRKVSPNSKLSIEIEGMVCEKGCGASIRKALKSTGGVASCSFDFEENRKKNVATIEYDKDKISADQIIDIVTSINEKQFSVSKPNSVKIDVKVNVKETASDEEESSETAEISVQEESRFEMPNLLEMFSGLLARSIH